MIKMRTPMNFSEQLLAYYLLIVVMCLCWSVESPQEAAEAAGRSYNMSDTGQCAWFRNTSSVLLTSTQVGCCVLHSQFHTKRERKVLYPNGEDLQILEFLLSSFCTRSTAVINSFLKSFYVQVAAGVWYLGVFSDTLPSRFQSKMVTPLLITTLPRSVTFPLSHDSLENI